MFHRRITRYRQDGMRIGDGSHLPVNRRAIGGGGIPVVANGGGTDRINIIRTGSHTGTTILGTVGTQNGGMSPKRILLPPKRQLLKLLLRVGRLGE